MDEGEAEADGDGGEAGGSTFVGGADDDEEEDAGQDGFGDEGSAHADSFAAECVESVDEFVGPAVGGEGAGGCSGEVRIGDEEEECSSCDAASTLGDDVSNDIFGIFCEATGGNKSECHGGVEVAAGDMADSISHGEDGETEGDRNADIADSEVVGATSEQGRAAAAEHEPECADKFSSSTFGKTHKIS